MVYTSPTKVARASVLKSHGHSDHEIALTLGVHRTTVGHILEKLKKTGDPYHQGPKTGRPRKFLDRDTWLAAVILARVQASTVTELAQSTFPDVSRHTIGRRLKDHGLVCRVR